MHCADCKHWITGQSTTYGDGSVVSNFKSPDGKGQCQQLKQETDASFGCIHFEPGTQHVITQRKNGAPWQHSHAGPCPDCRGVGSSSDASCYRCAGTGLVRHYDDGYIGEERTRLHPKEKELMAPPACSGCKKPIDINWVACPYCGQKLEAVAETEIIKDQL